MMRALFDWLNVDFDQWKALTVVALKLDFRLSAVGRSQFRRNVGTIAGLIGQFIFYTLVGAFLAFLTWFTSSLFLVGTVAVSYTMFIVGTAVLLDHNSALASPVDYAILGFRPIASRTYFAVRLTNVLVYTLAITTVAAWLPVTTMFMRYGAAVGVAAAAALLGSSLATAFSMLLAYAWMLKLVGADALKRALSYVQLVMSFLVYGGYFFVARVAARSVMSAFTLTKSPLLLLYPATWFASYLDLASGHAGPLELIPAAASVALLVVLAANLGGRLSLDYSERLGQLTTAASVPRRGSRSNERPAWWFVTGEARAVALLVRRQFANDQRFRMGVLGVLPMTVIYLLIGLRDGTVHDPFLPAPRGGPSPVTMVLIMMPSLLKLHLTRSEGFRASWVFFASPADRVKIVRASKDVLVAFFLVPYLVVLALVYTYMVGNLWHVVVHLALQGLLGYLVLQVAMLIDPALPFSRPARKGGNSIVMLVFLAAMGALSALLNAYSSTLYASVRSTLTAFAAIVLAGVVVDRLTRARVERQTASLEFEG
jgi:ABC-2 type transport system permease protein